MPIDRPTEISSFDESQLPNLKSQLNSIFQNGGAIKYTENEPTIENVAHNELVVYDPTTTADSDRRVYLITAKKHLIWLGAVTASSGTAVSPIPSVPSNIYPYLNAIKDADKDTIVHTEYSSDEDIVRIYTGGQYTMSVASVTSATAAAWSVVYSTADSYLKYYISGGLRMEM